MVPRLAMYGATSTALAAAVVGSALHTRANFFAAAVAVGMSSGSLMVSLARSALSLGPFSTQSRHESMVLG